MLRTRITNLDTSIADIAPIKPCPDITKSDTRPISRATCIMVIVEYLFIWPKILYDPVPISFNASKIMSSELNLTKRAAESRMGKGKGAVEYWAAVVKPGRIMFEIDGVSEELAREALRKANHKFSVKCKVVKAQDRIGG